MTRSIAIRGRVVRFLFGVLPASCRLDDAMRDRTICRQDAGSTFKLPLSRYAVRASELVVLLAVVLTASAAPAPDFSREVRPLLEKHCFKCHGPEKQKGGLRF